MADHFYFVVTPAPNQYPHGLTDNGGTQKFFIKFGDGVHGDRYSTHNPCFHIADNNHIAGSGTVGIPGSHAPGVRIAKFVEIHLLNRFTQVGNTEWYAVRPGHGGIAQLNTWLANLLQAFPGLRFDGDGHHTSDQVTWNWIQATLADITNHGFH